MKKECFKFFVCFLAFLILFRVLGFFWDLVVWKKLNFLVIFNRMNFMGIVELGSWVLEGKISIVGL